MITAIGHSNNPVTSQAVEEIIDQCRKSLSGFPPDFGIVFTSRMDADFQSILNQIKDSWPELQLVGGTTDGEISDIYPFTENSISLLLIHSNKISFSIGLGENISQDPELSVRRAFDQARKKISRDPVLALVLADGITTWGISLDIVLRSVLGDELPVFGATVGDHFKIQRTYQFYNNRVVSDAVILMLITGPAFFSMSLKSGWKPIGKLFQVNRQKGNVIWEIDGMPAIEFIRKYLGSHQKEYALFPLAVMIGDNDFLLRDPILLNEKDGSVSFVGTFPENSMIRLTEFDREDLILASARACDESLQNFPGSRPELALSFPCTSRRHILGTKSTEEHRIVMDYRQKNPSLRLFGMHGYGEIGPLDSINKIVFQNTSYALLLLGEEP